MNFFKQQFKPGTQVAVEEQKVKVVRTTIRTTSSTSNSTSSQPRYTLTPSSAYKRSAPTSTSSASSSSNSWRSKSNGSSRQQSKAKSDAAKRIFKRAPPTPILSSDESSDGEDATAAAEDSPSSKRKKLDDLRSSSTLVSEKRDLLNPKSFSELLVNFLHAKTVANLQTPNYHRYFLKDDERGLEVSIQHPASKGTEHYELVQCKESNSFQPLDDINKTVWHVATYLMPPDVAIKVLDDEGGIARRMVRNYNKKNQADYTKALKEYNALVRELRKSGRMKAHIQAMEVLPYEIVTCLIEQCYQRTVLPHADVLKQYEAFSDQVYGELMPCLLNRMYDKAKLRESSVFIDLGSGVGNAVLQAALQYGCESYGAEITKTTARLGAQQAHELRNRARLWGLKTGKIKLFPTSFFDNPEVDAIMKRADVLLVNNFQFSSETNARLIMMFLDVPDGARIISMKPFVVAGRVINQRNFNDPVSQLRSEEFDWFSSDVSWGSGDGKWYLTTIDREPLQRYHRVSAGRSSTPEVSKR